MADKSEPIPTGPTHPPGLNYATEGHEHDPNFQSGIDRPMGIWSALQSVVGIYLGLESNFDGLSSVRDLVSNVFFVGWVYAAVSVTAFLGAISPQRSLRRTLYLAYAIGLLTGMAFFEVIFIASPDPILQLSWQWPVVALIANPAFLLILVRRIIR